MYQDKYGRTWKFKPGHDTTMPFWFHDAGHEGPADVALVSVPWCELEDLAGRPCT